MVQFIKQLRAYYANRYPGKCSTTTPFVLATGCGDPQTSGNGLVVANAQLAVGDPAKYPEFAGNVKTMDTRGYWRDTSISPTNAGYHYNRNAETLHAHRRRPRPRHDRLAQLPPAPTPPRPQSPPSAPPTTPPAWRPAPTSC